MKKILCTLALIFSASFAVFAQMWNGMDTIYGNEWINYNQSYYKIMVANDGAYRISRQSMLAAGIPANSLQGAQYQLFRLGKEEPIYTSTNGVLTDADYIEFVGQKNRTELDQFLFANMGTELLNQKYSLFNDTIAYFLTWTSTAGGHVRYQNTPNTLNNLPPKEDFFTHTLEVEDHTTYEKRTSYFDKNRAVELYTSHFDLGEGFNSGFAPLRTIEFNPKFVFAAGGTSRFQTRLRGKNQENVPTVISINGTQIAQSVLAWGVIQPFNIEVSSSVLTTSTQLKIEGAEQHTFGNMALSYPRQFNFDNQTTFYFDVAASSNIKYLEIENFSTVADPILYDLTNNLRIVAKLENGKVRIALPSSATSRKLLLIGSTSSAIAAAPSNAVTFRDYRTLKNKNYIILTNKDFIGTPELADYAAYRQSAQGGAHQVTTVDVQELYDQFAYGVNRHAVGIRNFAHFVVKNWTAPHYLLIVGKGREYNTVRSEYGLSVSLADRVFFVPTFGNPGADNLLVSRNGASNPILSIGRLAATSGGEIKNYLDKIKDFDLKKNQAQTPDGQLWKKRIIHLGGGDNSDNSGPLIKNYLSTMENTVTNGKFGAQVSSFFKTSTDPIQISKTQQITDIINTGSSFVTFFGHSAVGNWDFSVDDPTAYNPKGRYPAIFSLGCFSGNIHTGTRGVSEKFLFTKDMGSIAFIAATSYGYIPALYYLTNESYRLMGAEMYGKSLGDIVHAASAYYSDKQLTTGLVELTQQLTFHGDPAILTHAASAPDYVTDPASVQFQPSVLNVRLDSFTLNFSVANLGKNVEDSLLIEISQELPNGFVAPLATKKIVAPAYQTNLSFRFAMPGKAASGLNRFFIKLNGSQKIIEAPLPTAYSNNELIAADGGRGVAVYVIDNVARPVYPQEFSIVNEPNVTLKASTLNTFSPNQKYIFELDTTELFNSASKARYEVTQKGGIVKWQPTGVAYQNNAVYYWRISADSIAGIGYNWSNSSFIYLPNSSKGWNQSHYYQLKKDRFDNVELPENTKKLKFINDVKIVRVRNAIVTNTYDANVAVNSGLYGGNVGGRYVHVVVFDTILGYVIENPGTKYGSIDQGLSINFVYDTETPSGRKKLMDVLNDSIPNHYYVIVYTVQNSPSVSYYPELWAADSLQYGTNLFRVLEQQGATKIRSTATSGSRPYIFAYRKNTAPLGENLATNFIGDIFVSFDINGLWDSGNVRSTTVGPARKWAQLKWRSSSPAGNPQTDKVSLDLYGIDSNNQEVLLSENIQSTDTSLAGISAQTYPYLRLKFNAKDATFRTSPNLDYWRVLYDGLPEVAVNPNAYFALRSDTLPQGAPFLMDIALENIGDFNTDSLLIRYTVQDDRNQIQLLNRRVKPLLKGDTMVVSLPLDTKTLLGKQRINMEVNPDNDQPELYHFNNYAFTTFLVDKDRRNPILDVTFDGQHILEGDIITTKPNILVTLKDENKYLALADTSLFRVLIQYPDEYVQRSFAFDGNIMKFYPASPNGLNKENKASIEIRPQFLKDGVYQLFVQARDASGNESGSINYKVSFEIVTKSAISNVLNYPNPFTTKTHFVYTLTGDDIPEYFKIQILSVAGKIVREITQDEIGALKVGTHRTEYAWNGTDEFGDKLANGVYLYRIVARKKDGSTYETRKNEADKFFENGFGKMVILR